MSLSTAATPSSTQEMYDALARGMQLQQAGDLDGASSVYNSILSREPEHAEAIHLFGFEFGGPEALAVMEASCAPPENGSRRAADNAGAITLLITV